MTGFVPWWAPWRRCWAKRPPHSIDPYVTRLRCGRVRRHHGDHAAPWGFDIRTWAR